VALITLREGSPGISPPVHRRTEAGD